MYAWSPKSHMRQLVSLNCPTGGGSIIIPGCTHTGTLEPRSSEHSEATRLSQPSLFGVQRLQMRMGSHISASLAAVRREENDCFIS